MADLFLGDQVPLENQIAAVEREIKYREHVYPRLVNGKKMTAGLAEYQIRAMKSVLASLHRLKGIVP